MTLPQLTCAKCDAPLTDETRVPVWDGRDYCRACVEEARPGMADYMVEVFALTEQGEMVHNREIAQAWGTRIFCLVLGVVALGVWLARLPSGVWHWASVVAAIFFAVAALPRLRRRRRYFWTTVREGLVGFRDPASEREEWVSLSQCSWRFAPSLPWPLCRLFPGKGVGSLVEIMTPKWRLTVGWDEHTRGLWTGFLNISGVPYWRGRGAVVRRLLGSGPEGRR